MEDGINDFSSTSNLKSKVVVVVVFLLSLPIRCSFALEALKWPIFTNGSKNVIRL